MTQLLDISIIIPFFNEEASLSVLYHEIINVVSEFNYSFEIILIDDGSNDNSQQIVCELQKDDAKIRILSLKSNSGKSSALNQGFLAAKGEIVFTMDADLQDDPREIPSFLEKIDEGYDLVSGWKKKRFDPLEKRLPSKLFNHITSLVTGIKLNDFNCGFKAYRREVVEELNIYGDLHRFIPALAYWKGFRVCEIPVQHHPRKFGESKYGWKRYYQGFLDLFTVILLTRFIRRPIYLFGLTGLFIGGLGLGILLFITFLQFLHGSILGHKPLSYLGVLSFLLGSQMVAVGLIAEMLVALKDRKDKSYSIKEIFSSGREKTTPDLSVIIPIHNERKTLEPFLIEFVNGLEVYGNNVEIIFIDDGSTDNSFEIIKKQNFSGNCAIRGIRLRKFFGRSSALQAGYDLATGKVIMTITPDLQNIFVNINRLMDLLINHVHIAKGMRTGMSFWGAFFSKIFNKVVSFLSGVKFHDYHCGFYAFKKEIIDNLKISGEKQFFDPLLAAKQGTPIIEVPVSYTDFRPVELSQKLKRISTDLLDILTIKLVTDFKAKPLHLFGLIGIFIGMAGLFINIYLTCLKFLTGDMNDHYTFLLMGVTLMIMGLQWFTTGLLGEIINSLNQSKIDKDDVEIIEKARDYTKK